MKILKATLSSVSILFVCGCNVDGKAHVTFSVPSGPDFKRSVIISNDPVPADGVSPLLVVVDLLNADGTPVVLFTPKYEIASGQGVVTSECTPSNSNGAATCILKSVQPGVKSLSVTNIKIDLKKDLTFTSPRGITNLSLAAAANPTTLVTSQGDVAQVQIGTTFLGKTYQTSDGYKMKIGSKSFLGAR